MKKLNIIINLKYSIKKYDLLTIIYFKCVYILSPVTLTTQLFAKWANEFIKVSELKEKKGNVDARAGCLSRE